MGAPANTSANNENATAGNGRRNNEYFFLNQRSEIIDCPTLTATVSQVTYQGENPTQTASNSLHFLAAEALTPHRFWLVVPTYNPGLAEWADLHGHTVEPEPAETFECERHGDYRPRSLLDADCPLCDLEAADACFSSSNAEAILQLPHRLPPDQRQKLVSHR